MRHKLWVIGALLLLACSTGLAQTYSRVINRTMDENFELKKETVIVKEGVIVIDGDYITIDNTMYKFIEFIKADTLKSGFNCNHYIIYNPRDKVGRTYTCVLSHKNNKLQLVEIWKSHMNCIYYVIKHSPTKNISKYSSPNTRLSPHSKSGPPFQNQKKDAWQ